MTLDFKQKNKGFLVLTMVLLVSATVLIIVTGTILRSIGKANMNADSGTSLQALSVVNACGEYALSQMIASPTSTSTTAANWAYAGDVILPVGEETCYIYTVVDGDDGAKLIQASSTISGFTKKILIEVATNTPSIKVSSWEEVANFEN